MLLICLIEVLLQLSSIVQSHVFFTCDTQMADAFSTANKPTGRGCISKWCCQQKIKRPYEELCGLALWHSTARWISMAAPSSSLQAAHAPSP